MGLSEAIRETISNSLVLDSEYKDRSHLWLRILSENEGYLAIDGQKIPFLDIDYKTPWKHDHLGMLLAAQLRQMLGRNKNYLHADTNREYALSRQGEGKESVDGLFTRAEFWEGRYGESGVIEASEPFVVSGGPFILATKPKRAIRAKTIVGNKTRFPLEVGSVAPSKLMTLMAECGCFARWPHGMNYIFFFEQVV